MKTTASILLLIAATASTSCDVDKEPSYIRQDQLAIKTFPIVSLVYPRLLPDGSLITIEGSNSMNSTITRNGEADVFQRTDNGYTFRFARLTKDGTISYSSDFSFNMGSNGDRQFGGANNNFNDEYCKLDITQDGGAIFGYCNPSATFALSSFDGGTIVNTTVSSMVSDLYVGCAPLSDSTYAIIHGNDPTMSILNSHGEWFQHVLLPDFKCSNDKKYYVYGLCGNIMIVCIEGQTDGNQFYVYSPAGELLNYGSTDYAFDNVVNVSDPSANTAYGYAIVSNTQIQDDDGNSEKGGIIIKLDSNGNAIFEYQTSEITDIYNITHHNGSLMVAGDCMSVSMDFISNTNDMSRMMSTITGKIITLNPDTGDEIAIYPISLEGGVMPYAVVPDDGGGYYVYMSRIMTSDVGMMGNTASYGSSIYIYHTDDLNKLNVD